MSGPTAHDRERAFHDELAAARSDFAPRQPDHLEHDLIARLPRARGRTLLELGCGDGELTLQLAATGADITALDVSPGMVEVARRRVNEFVPGARVRFIAAPAEATGLPDGAFDLIVGKWILHHADVVEVSNEIHRLLRPDGLAIFIENSGGNPILHFARQHLAGRFGIPRFGTEDEHPLVAADLQLMADIIGYARLDYPDFVFFQLFDRQVLRFRFTRVSRLLALLDGWAYRQVPQLRKFSFHVVVTLARRRPSS